MRGNKFLSQILGGVFIEGDNISYIACSKGGLKSSLTNKTNSINNSENLMNFKHSETFNFKIFFDNGEKNSQHSVYLQGHLKLTLEF